ncbi:SGNH/GDSL hydrolase family protein, partial [Acinetobacter soli]|uniref:SGNH/GDSL hydrolase family protein n=1 Tax=Acinetobacter soli TaxID=487316 RepID=UPI00125D6A35
TFKSLNNAFIDAVLVYGTLPNDLRVQNFPSKLTVDAGITNSTITIRGDNLNFNSSQFNVIAGGERLEVLFNNLNFVAKFYIDFTKAPTLAVNSNSSGYFFDVSRLNIKQNSRKDGYFAKQSYSETRSKVINDSYKIPKIIHNYLNDTFLNPIAFYPDLSTTAGSIPTNSNLQDPDYTLGYRLTHASSYSKIYDNFAGESLKYPVNFGTSPASLFTVSNIYRNCEMLIGMKIDPSLVKASSFVIRNGSGAESRYSFFDGVASQTNNTNVTATLISNDIDTGYSIWKIVINPDLAIVASQSQSITARNTSTSTGTFDIIAYNPILSEKINYQSDIPQSKTKDSPWVGKNLMYFGDSNSRGNIAIEMIKNLGCNVYWNAEGGRSMQYRGVSDAAHDMGWLYHWERRSHIKTLKDAGKLIDLFLFHASYNDTSGGGTLSDEAIQAVLDNYPTLQDDAATVTSKLAIFSAMTVQQRKDIFGYKQTFAAYLLQIITMFPTAKIFLSTMLYSPASIDGTGSTSGTVNQQRAYDKPIRDAINADIRAIAAWYGVTVLDAATHAGYYYGNMTNYTSDTIHFNEIIGKRIGYFEAKSILMQTV